MEENGDMFTNIKLKNFKSKKERFIMNMKIKKFLKKASCFGMGMLAFVGAAFGNVSLYSNNNYLVSANETPAAYVYREGGLNNNEHQNTTMKEESSRTMDSNTSTAVQEYLQDPEKYASKESEKKTISDHILDSIQFVLKEVKENAITVFACLLTLCKKLCDKICEKIMDLFVDEAVDELKKKRKKKHKKSKRK